MQKEHDFDLFVIGAGSGGVRAARMAAQRGQRVAVAEAAAMGGTCVNVGCIPKKLYSYAAGYAEAFEEARGYGWTQAAPSFDFDMLKKARAKEIGRLNDIYTQLLHSAGVRIVEGWAQICGPHEVVVGKQRFSARHILVATGGRPHVPDIPGKDLVLTSEAMFDIDPFPRRLVVAGGGYIACEFASIFRGLGAEVTLVQRGGRLLRGFDHDVQTFIASEMGKTGIDIRLNCEIAAIVRQDDGSLLLTLAGGGQLEADAVLYATGRVANTTGLGLENVALRTTDKGAIAVDAHYRTNVPSIHAIGDVSSRMQLTPVALGEAMALVDHLFGDGRRRMDYEYVPTAVFTHPNIGTVGLTETAAREKYGKVTLFRADFRALRHTLSGRDERTLVKLVVDAASDLVVGLHVVGPDAGEIVQGFAVALRAGATKKLFDSTVGIHPTLAEELVTLRTPAPDGE
ncbi:glutathione-disulfide reductase [Xylophilus ampelinus]|uniref:NADPH-glutathione reductase n=1 Tax=Xylophilus ampelinus TaxID=54067 RepID=A0A318SHJ8_9BURK|nr:glutathione-disulfide reductase [Xylophilus ampelinus]MCS4510263.1 glutathione-disulfide reductase [Xylophilus ampelinus]PYE78116.1 NADPH-glutathione reductase [Xylophilus ampelinus]